MEIVSFLFVDDIPVDIINVGMPQIDDDHFIDALQDSLGVKQIVEILTIFSLFQICDQDTLSVHRLVQEVIRNDINDLIQMKRVLGYETCINQRQDEALSDQDQMLHVITSLNLSGDKVKELTSIKIPLLEKDRIRIQKKL